MKPNRNELNDFINYEKNIILINEAEDKTDYIEIPEEI